MTPRRVAVVDANVLYSIELTGLLVTLAVSIGAPRWSVANGGPGGALAKPSTSNPDHQGVAMESGRLALAGEQEWTDGGDVTSK